MVVPILKLTKRFVLHNIFISVIIVLFFYLNFNTINCFPVRENTTFLKNLTHNNICFKASQESDNIFVKSAFDVFLLNSNKPINPFIANFYWNNNGIYTPFNSKSPYYHPNIYLGRINGYHFCIPCSHENYQNCFVSFSEKDVLGFKKPQFISKYLCVYDPALQPQHWNNLFLNKGLNFLGSKIDIETEIKSTVFLRENSIGIKDSFNSVLKQTSF